MMAVKSRFPLCSERLQFQLFSEQDITEEYLAWLHDPEVTKYSRQRFNRNTYEDCRHYLDSFTNSDSAFLLIKEKVSQQSIGTMTLYVSSHHNTVDMGIMMGNRHFWGQGLGQEAWQCIQHLMHGEVGVRKVTGGTLSCHQAMIKIMTRAGMKPDGTRVAQELFNNEPCDIVHFASFKE